MATPGEYHVVFASGQLTPDYVDAAGHAHTNFRRGGGGEYAALVAPALNGRPHFFNQAARIDTDRRG